MRLNAAQIKEAARLRNIQRKSDPFYKEQDSERMRAAYRADPDKFRLRKARRKWRKQYGPLTPELEMLLTERLQLHRDLGMFGARSTRIR